MCIRINVKYTLLVSGLNNIDRFSKKPFVSNFMKNRRVGVKLFHADREAERRTGMMKPIAAFQNY